MQKQLANSYGVYTKEYNTPNAINKSYIKNIFVSGLIKYPIGSASSSDSFSSYESMTNPPRDKKRNLSPTL